MVLFNRTVCMIIEKRWSQIAGNKYADVTEKNILDMATKLFIEKGYENTSLQDIAEACGLTRGAIYHHFKGKEDMVDAVTTHVFTQSVLSQNNTKDENLSGLERLKNVLIRSLAGSNQSEMLRMLMKSLMRNPKMLAAYLESIKSSTVPMLQPMIEAGILDGSIQTGDANILAELTSVIFELWLSPMLFDTFTNNMLEQKLAYAKTIFDSIGLPLGAAVYDALDAALSLMISAE